MKLLDVNILVEAHRPDAPHHAAISEWLRRAMQSYAGVGVSDLVLSGFLRVVTHPRVFRDPTPFEQALEFVDDFRSRASVHHASPGVSNWTVFRDLLQRYEPKGNRVPDLYHAALAIEFDYTWVSLDRGFSQYRELNWLHPLDAAL